VVVLLVVIVQVKLQESETVLQQLLLKEILAEMVVMHLALVIMFQVVEVEQLQQVQINLEQQQVLVELEHQTQLQILL
jgi:hypothetical protein